MLTIKRIERAITYAQSESMEFSLQVANSVFLEYARLARAALSALDQMELAATNDEFESAAVIAKNILLAARDGGGKEEEDVKGTDTRYA